MAFSPHIQRRVWRALLVCPLVLVCLWWIKGESRPSPVIIAAGHREGLYWNVAQALGRRLQTRGYAVEVRATHGAEENRQLLREGLAHLAILQTTDVAETPLCALAPLFPEVVSIVARKSSHIESVVDLAGKNVAMGDRDSGTRLLSQMVAKHYRLAGRLVARDVDFERMRSDPSLDAAIITCGLLDPRLAQLVQDMDARIVPILDADALVLRHPCLAPATIPRGCLTGQPDVPEAPTPTVQVTAFLAARENAPGVLVRDILAVLYGDAIRSELPGLLPSPQKLDQSLVRLHPQARAYFNPYLQLQALSNFVQWVVRVKEWLFSLGAGLYLLWDLRRRVQEKQRNKLLAAQRARLEQLLSQTVQIEHTVLGTPPGQDIHPLIDRVLALKAQAMREVIDEQVRSEQLFGVLLSECNSLVRLIRSHPASALAHRPAA